MLNPIEKFKVAILHMKRDWNHWGDLRHRRDIDTFRLGSPPDRSIAPCAWRWHFEARVSPDRSIAPRPRRHDVDTLRLGSPQTGQLHLGLDVTLTLWGSGLPRQVKCTLHVWEARAGTGKAVHFVKSINMIKSVCILPVKGSQHVLNWL